MSSTTYIGQIKLFAFSSAPKGWLKCDGSLLEVKNYELLFNYIGRAYGEMTVPQDKFRLPDLRGTVPIHRGRGEGLSNNYILGRAAGSANFAMRSENMPRHWHLHSETVYFYPPCSLNPANTPSPVKAFLTMTSGTPTYASVPLGTNPDRSCVTPMTAENVSVTPAGSSQPFSLQQPSIGLNYCICYDGIFPSQN
ncbi:phage tail protein [Flavobacterium sp. 3HN19-14]|uniref:phage tail protein n=1 Tax=Flavobacterium sp. 3HN19-14 TaxID=3448133 RepID=UPI003EE3B8C1